MQTMTFRFLTTLAALAITTGAAACGAADTTNPGAAAPTSSELSSPTAQPSPAAVPATSRAPSPRDCHGAIVYKVEADDIGRSVSSVCVTVGGEIHIEHLGPGSLSASDWTKAECNYEAGMHWCRLLHTGSLKFTVDLPGGRKHINVEIAAAISPPRPAPACMNTGTFTYDLNQEYIWVPAYCVKLGSVLKLLNANSASIVASPANAVSCRNVGSSHECLFHTAATVKLTLPRQGTQDRLMYVVAIA